MEDSVNIASLVSMAIAVAISPGPMMVAILLLLSPRARTSGPAFLIGWILGVAISLAAFALLGTVEVDGEEVVAHPLRAGLIDLVLGLALLYLAWAQWRKRPGPEDEPHMPKWMAGASGMAPMRALALALALAVLIPKNLILSASAGATIAGLRMEYAWLAVVVFALLASWTIAIPVLAVAIGGKRADGPLQRVNEYLTKNNAIIMAVVLLVLAAVLLSKAAGNFIVAAG